MICMMDMIGESFARYNCKQKHVLSVGTRGKIYARLASAGKHLNGGGKRGKLATDCEFDCEK